MRQIGKYIGTGIIGMVSGVLMSGRMMERKANELIAKEQTLKEKHLDTCLMLDDWLKLKQEGKGLEDYCKKNNIYSIAIYGMNYLGITVLREFDNSCVNVKYGIDINGGTKALKIPVISPDAKLDEVDAVIVTPIAYFEDINKLLMEKMKCDIIPLDEMIRESY